ncbi:MAG: aminomethyl-transferring glycine dehydrogenase subunit GcvPA [bacterium]|nr:aminomethyl-transferring glycine dehydrogenase subunit GcvPA [bacterium]
MKPPYIPFSEEEQQEMLRLVGVKSVDGLFIDIPVSVRLNRPLDLPPALSEPELFVYFQELADKNIGKNYISFLGAGAYDHYIPAAVDTIISRSEFYTAYTPYQAEASQGTLQTIYEYQSLICELTGMAVANASMYDGATAMAEAAIMATRATDRKQILVARTVHPQYREVLKTYCHTARITVQEIPYSNGVIDLDILAKLINQDTATVIIQHPNFFGCLEPVFDTANLIHQQGGLLISSVNPISLGILAPPNEYDTDITVMEGQPLGNPLNFGGPYLGILACKQELLRLMPGRVVGMTKDTLGNPGFVLTLQTREQHIRRQKAVSNICSNQALNALSATVYLSLLGKQGLKEVAELNLQKASYAKRQIAKLTGYNVLWQEQPTFNEFIIQCANPDKAVNKILLDAGFIGGYPLEQQYPELKNSLLFCVTEKRTKEQVDRLISLLQKIFETN